MFTSVSIAGIYMEIKTPFSYELMKQFQPFHSEKEHSPKLNITFVPVGDPVVAIDHISKVEFYQDSVLKKDNIEYLGFHFTNQPCHAWMTINGTEMIVYYLKDSLDCFPSERQVFGPICLEYIFSIFHGYILHSSFIKWKERGILFTAPSGVGKSTQAELWKYYENADILNGDRTAIRFDKNVWEAYGLPYAGSSDIFRNESAPIAAIIVLEQAPVNRLKRLHGIQAFKALFSQLTLHPWDPSFMQRIMDNLNLMLQDVPVYKLLCTPDQRAVDILKQELEEIVNGR